MYILLISLENDANTLVLTWNDISLLTSDMQNDRLQSSYLLFLRLFQGIKDSKLINMLTFNDWPTGRDLPASIESFHVMLGRVNSYKRSFGNHPVTILCQ